jgi:hypothetical protein
MHQLFSLTSAVAILCVGLILAGPAVRGEQ